MATAKASKNQTNTAPQPPKGMKVIHGGYAKTWNVDEMPVLEGKVSEGPKTVTLNKGTKKEADRRCVEVTTDDGSRYTLWESAGLAGLFEKLAEAELPVKVWVAFRGLGTAKKGQNAPKLFDAAISD